MGGNRDDGHVGDPVPVGEHLALMGERCRGEVALREGVTARNQRAGPEVPHEHVHRGGGSGDGGQLLHHPPEIVRVEVVIAQGLRERAEHAAGAGGGLAEPLSGLG